MVSLTGESGSDRGNDENEWREDSGWLPMPTPKKRITHVCYVGISTNYFHSLMRLIEYFDYILEISTISRRLLPAHRLLKPVSHGASGSKLCRRGLIWHSACLNNR